MRSLSIIVAALTLFTVTTFAHDHSGSRGSKHGPRRLETPPKAPAGRVMRRALPPTYKCAETIGACCLASSLSGSGSSQKSDQCGSFGVPGFQFSCPSGYAALCCSKANPADDSASGCSSAPASS